MNATLSNYNGVRHPDDAKLIVNFYVTAIESELKSKEQERAVFDDCEMIKIQVQGDNESVIDTLVTREYRERFPQEYAAFKANTTLDISGTPLELWPYLTPSQIAQFKAMNIRTVEGLAEIADSKANFMNSHEVRAKAKAFLKVSADSSVVEKQEEAIAKQAAEMAELRAQIAALSEKKAK